MSPTPATPITSPERPRPAPGGRFRPGNPGGPGNPYARQCAALRRAAARVVTAEDAEEVMRAFLAKAKGGDLAAAKFVFSYALGKPAAAPDLGAPEWEDETPARAGAPAPEVGPWTNGSAGPAAPPAAGPRTNGSIGAEGAARRRQVGQPVGCRPRHDRPWARRPVR